MNSIRQNVLTIGRWTVRSLRNVSNDMQFRISLVQSSAVLAALFLAASWFFLDRARPDMTTFIDRHLGKKLRVWWDPEMARTGETLLVVSFVISMLGLFAYWSVRKKRRSRASWLLGIVAAASLVSLIMLETVL